MKRRALTPEEHPKGSGLYRVRPRIKGKLRTICSGVSHAEAVEHIRALDELRERAVLREGITLTDFGKGFLDRRERRGIGGIDQERDRWSLMVERDAIGGIPIPELERGDFLDWFDRWAPKNVQTRRNALNLVRKALDEAVDRDLCKVNVARQVKVEKAGRANDFDEFGGVLFPHEQAALLAVLPELDLDAEALRFALYGGLRQGSHWALLREDCTTLERVCLRKHKSRRPRWLRPLEPARAALDRALRLAAALASPFAFPAPRGGKRHTGKVPDKFRGWLKAAGITRRVRWHDLRHTCATSLLAGWWGRKWTLDEVCSYMHHSSTKVTERYARFLEETLEQAVAETKFPGGNGGGGKPAITLPAEQSCKTVTRRFESDPRLQQENSPNGHHEIERRGTSGELRSPAAWSLALAAEAALAGGRVHIVPGRIRRRRRRDVG